MIYDGYERKMNEFKKMDQEELVVSNSRCSNMEDTG